MKYLLPAGIGATVGVVYGTILWFVKSQVEYIYSQGVPFKTYYDPNILAFEAAFTSAILCLLAIMTYPLWCGVFFDLAERIKESRDD